jgi:WG containing repeat
MMATQALAFLCSVLILATGAHAAQTTLSDPLLYPLRSSITGRVGYVDRLGKYVIEPVFEDCDYTNEGRPFVDGMARVGCGPFGYVNHSGKLVMPYNFEDAADFSEGLAPVSVGGKYGYVDNSGTFLIKPRFDYALPYSEGLAAVRIGNLFGYINRDNDFVIPPRYERAGAFCNDLAPVRIDKKFGYINKSGGVVVAPSYEFGGDFSDGLAAIELNGKYGYLGITGKVSISPRFQFAGKFANGLAPVKIDGHFGFINKAGELTIPATFESAFPFQNELALVQIPTLQLDSSRQHIRYAYVDQSGHYILTGSLVRVPSGTDRSNAAVEFDVPRLPVKIHSTPAGAKVWLIPLETVDSEPDVLHDDDKLLRFLLPAYTPIDGEQVIEQVFLAIVKINGKSVRRYFDVNKSHENRLEVDFAKEP